jgi:hypothetical protein
MVAGRTDTACCVSNCSSACSPAIQADTEISDQITTGVESSRSPGGMQLPSRGCDQFCRMITSVAAVIVCCAFGLFVASHLRRKVPRTHSSLKERWRARSIQTAPISPKEVRRLAPNRLTVLQQNGATFSSHFAKGAAGGCMMNSYHAAQAVHTSHVTIVPDVPLQVHPAALPQPQHRTLRNPLSRFPVGVTSLRSKGQNAHSYGRCSVPVYGARENVASCCVQRSLRGTLMDRSRRPRQSIKHQLRQAESRTRAIHHQVVLPRCLILDNSPEQGHVGSVHLKQARAASSSYRAIYTQNALPQCDVSEPIGTALIKTKLPDANCEAVSPAWAHGSNAMEHVRRRQARISLLHSTSKETYTAKKQFRSMSSVVPSTRVNHALLDLFAAPSGERQSSNGPRKHGRSVSDSYKAASDYMESPLWSAALVQRMRTQQPASKLAVAPTRIARKRAQPRQIE